MLSLSAFTFGGGYVIIPLIRKKFVEQLGWLEEAEMLDMVAIAQTSPGAVTVNVAVQLGERLAGVRGSLCAVAGTLLPPVALLAVISIFYTAFRDSAAVGAFLQSMQAGVAAVIAYAVWSMAGNAVKAARVRNGILMALAFGAIFGLGVNVIVVLVACGVIGALGMLWRMRKNAA